MRCNVDTGKTKHGGLMQGEKKISDLLLYMRADAAFTAAVHATLADQPSKAKGKPNKAAVKKRDE
jgi:hypothetical protein